MTDPMPATADARPPPCAGLTNDLTLRAFRWGAALVMLCAAVVSTAGMVRLPLDEHEVFVAQTARQMMDSGDWVVPWFGGVPRLNKPPLSYWLTMLAAWASGARDIQPWHARLPSAL